MPRTRSTTSIITRLQVLVSTALLAGIAAAPAVGQMQITYTGNDGVLLTSGEDKVLIDSLQNLSLIHI